jgi:glycosyltransferase involved in cell wall biosynthesis
MTIAAAIAVYNGANLIRRSLESILGQTRAADEVIVVDDGSTDNTPEIVQSYLPRVRYLRQNNSGVSTARNRAAREATSEWIAYLDHDDEWLPRKLERQAAAVETHPDASLCYTAYWMRELDGSQRVAHIPETQVWPSARMRNPFPPSVVMLRRAQLLESGGFYEGLKRAGVEDWEFFARFLADHRVIGVNEPLANYYVVPNSASQNHQRMLADSLNIVDRGLLAGLTGSNRAVWRRRIRAMIYYRTAISAREGGYSATGLLLRSFREWPVPDVAPERWKTAAAWAARMVTGKSRTQTYKGGK